MRATFNGLNTVQTAATLGVGGGGVIASDGSADGTCSVQAGARQHAMQTGQTFTVMHDTVGTYAYDADRVTIHGKPVIRKIYG